MDELLRFKIDTDARHLADYLQYLHKNKTAYEKYFEWRLKPPGLSELRSVQPWCNLCHKIVTETQVNDDANAQTFAAKALTRRSYDNIYSWWFSQGPCQSQIVP